MSSGGNAAAVAPASYGVIAKHAALKLRHALVATCWGGCGAFYGRSSFPRTSSGSLVKFAAMRGASSPVSRLVGERAALFERCNVCREIPGLCAR